MTAMTEAARKTCALVVEDDPNIVDLIRSNLAVRGFDTVVSVDGMRALQLLETEDPDIVLLDLMLPEADGFELCRQIRERSPVAIIVVSARGADRAAGVAGHSGRRYRHRPGPAASDAERPAGSPDPDRVRPAARARGQPGQAADPRPSAPPGVGSRLRDRDRVPARLCAAAAGQARGGGKRAADPHPAPGRLPAGA